MFHSLNNKNKVTRDIMDPEHRNTQIKFRRLGKPEITLHSKFEPNRRIQSGARSVNDMVADLNVLKKEFDPREHPITFEKLHQMDGDHENFPVRVHFIWPTAYELEILDYQSNGGDDDEFLVRWVTGPLGERETTFDKLRSGMVVKSTDLFPRDHEAERGGSIHYPPQDVPLLVRNTDLGQSPKNMGKRGRASVCRKAEFVWREGHGDHAEIHKLVVGHDHYIKQASTFKSFVDIEII
jgi:hypothetical protein